MKIISRMARNRRACVRKGYVGLGFDFPNPFQLMDTADSPVKLKERIEAAAIKGDTPHLQWSTTLGLLPKDWTPPDGGAGADVSVYCNSLVATKLANQ